MDCTGKRRFYSFADWAAFWTGTLVSFLVYFATCAPSVTLEDCGELAVAGDYAGVPHPPGYPSWTMCAWVFARLLSWVTFRGRPNPAWAIATMSAFWGALATGIMAMLVSRTAADMLRIRARGASSGRESAASGAASGGPLARVAGAACFEDVAGFVSGTASSLVFAFSPVMWSQCTIVEVYSFNAFFMMLLLLLAYRWMRRQGDGLLVATAFFFGLGLTNYQVLLLALVPLVLAILLQDIHLFRDLVLAAIPFGLTAGILKLGALYSSPGFPKHDPLDPGCPVGGALIDPSWYWAEIAAVAVFLVAVGVRGWIAVREKSGAGAPAWADDAKLPLALVAAVAGAAALLVCFCVPSATDPWAERLPEISRAAIREGRPDPVFHWGLPVAAFLAGLAALWAFALFTPGGPWYAAAVTGFELPLAVLLKKGALLGLTHPLSGYFAVYVALDAAVMLLAFFLLERGRVVALSFLAGQAGAAFYAFMPIAADACPPMNWGYPRTWEGFKHALSRGQYEKISPTSMFSPLFIHQLGDYFSDVRMQFTLVLAPFGVLPFAAWRARRRGREIDLLPFAALAAAAVACLVALDRASAGLDLSGHRVDKLLFLALLAAAAVGVHAVAAKCLASIARTALDRSADRSARLVSGVSAAVLALAAVGFAGGFLNAAAEFALEGALGRAFGPGFAVETWKYWGAADFLLTAAAFAAYLAGVGVLFARELRGRPAVDLGVGEIGARWHAVVFVCFLMMSIVLIALANPHGDVQDSFIQKVKFIASHGLYALWIGYGAALAFEAVGRRRRGAFAAACALALASPLIPIHENYFNFHLADVTSGADQNGHDFGWQFGNYQLRGAEAIAEELSRDEEPLPNPFFPPEMDPNAIFFGGTDPGRFVPTYMIYSARVRPDVYLITQNALADNTYLDTMRGLYADDIWMPSTDDNREAFSEYTDDVRSGRRPDLGGLSIDSQGRVSVNGAYSVMEINGILCKQIFDRNRDAHSFYVEESYAIPWMYPYLVPNGLIMKICRDPVRWTGKTVDDDMDFWDWYSRRLLASPRFGRDFPARKSFNKLRSSIAGAYANRGDLDGAERAFRQAHSLFVYSPETAMRLSREVLLPRRRFDDAVTVFEQLRALDPNNRALPIAELRAMRDADANVRALAPRLRTGEKLSAAELISLLRDALAAGNSSVAAQALGAVVADPEREPGAVWEAALCVAAAGRKAEASPVFAALSPSFFENRPTSELRTAADCHVAAGDASSAVSVLSAMLRRDQSNWSLWLEYAIALSGAGDTERSTKALAFALRTGGEDARKAIARLPAEMADAVRPLLAPAPGASGRALPSSGNLRK